MHLGKIYKSLPLSVQKLLTPYVVAKDIKKKNEEIKDNYTELTQKQINNLKIVLNREDFLSTIPLNGVAAEIGVDTGTFTEKILEITKPSKLHLIDLWGTKRYPEEKHQIVSTKFSNLINENKVEIHRGFSTEMLLNFPENYFDWVYIDSGHGFKVTYQELIILKDKVKPHGIISGHDYCRYKSNGQSRFGVVEAVNKFCVEYNYEFLYLTNETHRHLSFAIRKIHE